MNYRGPGNITNTDVRISTYNEPAVYNIIW